METMGPAASTTSTDPATAWQYRRRALVFLVVWMSDCGTTMKHPRARIREDLVAGADGLNLNGL